MDIRDRDENFIKSLLKLGILIFFLFFSITFFSAVIELDSFIKEKIRNKREVALMLKEQERIRVQKEKEIKRHDCLEYHDAGQIKEKCISNVVSKGKKPQFVLISFDGSRSIPFWQKTRNFAKKMNLEGKPIRFTYFINAIYFLTENSASKYVLPDGSKVESLIGYGEENDINERIKQVKLAIEENHEIASHGVGHFPGGKWTLEEWTNEFNLFNKILIDNSIDEKIVGYRAPELEVNKNLFKVQKDFGFLYDSSSISSPREAVFKDENGLWHLPLGTVFLGENWIPSISMDYSIWQVQSNGKNVVKKDSVYWESLVSDTEEAYTRYFESNYNNERNPVIIGHHFTEWNDGVYFEALKRFVSKVCGKEDVFCSTGSDLVWFLEQI